MSQSVREGNAGAKGGGLRGWLLGDLNRDHASGPHAEPTAEHQRPWWQVKCLTGLDYFSTLGYQPGIAALAAGVLSPIATVVLVLLTLFGALPVYRRVARESTQGQGSIAMLERILPRWTGKLSVLALLGFAGTDFIITITLSAADATAHVRENPYLPSALHGQQISLTLMLVALLGAVFLNGLKEAISIAVALVGVYLALNTVSWTEGNPAVYLLRYLFFGDGEIAPSPARYSAKQNPTAASAPSSTPDKHRPDRTHERAKQRRIAGRMRSRGCPTIGATKALHDEVRRFHDAHCAGPAGHRPSATSDHGWPGTTPRLARLVCRSAPSCSALVGSSSHRR